MDRIISDEERIRRAEDVLERRRNYELSIPIENRNMANYSKLWKVMIQTAICLMIYLGYRYVKDIDNGYAVDIKNNLQIILSQDVDFKAIYEESYNQFKKINFMQDAEENNIMQMNDDNKETVVEELKENNSDLQDNNTKEEPVGMGGIDDISIKNSESSKSQMILDAEDIKSKYEFSKPLKDYTVTSHFGPRTSNEIVSANHGGIDLGAITGTEILSATGGTVVEANEIGDYGKHIKVQIDDTEILYAHCSKLFVKEGENLKQGQKIAEVGSTGKATGPHLHFEIRKDTRTVDPELIIEF